MQTPYCILGAGYPSFNSIDAAAAENAGLSKSPRPPLSPRFLKAPRLKVSQRSGYLQRFRPVRHFTHHVHHLYLVLSIFMTSSLTALFFSWICSIVSSAWARNRSALAAFKGPCYYAYTLWSHYRCLSRRLHPSIHALKCQQDSVD